MRARLSDLPPWLLSLLTPLAPGLILVVLAAVVAVVVVATLVVANFLRVASFTVLTILRTGKGLPIETLFLVGVAVLIEILLIGLDRDLIVGNTSRRGERELRRVCYFSFCFVLFPWGGGIGVAE